MKSIAYLQTDQQRQAARILEMRRAARAIKPPRAVIEAELAKRRARAQLLDFLQYVWWMPHQLIIGRHTRAICERLDRAIEDLEAGRSTFLDVGVPFRHGKSDIVSRALPAFFLGRLAERQPDVILSGYGASLVESFSRRVQAIIESPAYRELFPSVRLGSKAAVGNWSLDGSVGEVIAVGLGGALTGRGGSLIVIDDYCKERAEAESEVYRNGIWEAFKDGAMTRRAPACIVIVCATRWHVDDLIGRINGEMAHNPDFPQFEHLIFPAGDNTGEPLLAERFGIQWYREQRATLREYSAAALMDCSPVLRGGNRIRVDKIQFLALDDPMPPDILWVRCWDLASTGKERAGDDPDWTWGTRLGVRVVDGAPWLYIDDCRMVQAEAPERDRLIRTTAEDDGPACWIGIEAVAGYKDTLTTMTRILEGRAVVHGVECSKDKEVCAASLEPVFESGHVVMRRASWTDRLVTQLMEFPSGKHDDGVDSVSKGFLLALSRIKATGAFGSMMGMGADRW